MAWSPFKTQNTRQQDIFLFAKMAYQRDPNKTWAGTALQICAAHAGMEPVYVSYKDVASIIVHEFVEPQLILKNPRDLARVLIEIGPDPHFPRILGGNQHQEGGYFAALIDGLIGEITRMPVFTDPQNQTGWIPPFDRPIVDPKLQELIYVPEPEPVTQESGHA